MAIPRHLGKRVTRREFLRSSALVVTGGMLALSGVAKQRTVQEYEKWWFRELAAAPAKSPNVLVIVMDTVRYDRFALSMTESSLTPNLDRIVSNGIRFENAWANSSWSLPSQASILTGRYPHEHGADWPYLQLSENYPTLGEFFTSRGYVTGAFSGNAAWITPEYLGRGFLRFQVYTLEDHLRRTVHGRKLDRLLREVGYDAAGRGKKAPMVNAQFLKFLDDYHGYPFFAYLCYMDVNQAYYHRKLNHGFWEERPPVQEIIEAYDQALRLLDAQIANLFDELRHRDLLENTLIIITSDHGQSFGAAETEDHDPEGHGTSLYPEQTRVPLFIIYPGNLPAGTVVTRPVGLEAIPATITQLLGIEGSPFSEKPLPTIWKPEKNSDSNDTGVLTTLNYGDRKIEAVVWDHWLYIRNLNVSQASDELYDLATDPLAKESLATTQSALSSMQERLQYLLATES